MERKSQQIQYNTNTWNNIIWSGVRDGVLLGGSFYLGQFTNLPTLMILPPLFGSGYLIGKNFKQIEDRMHIVKKPDKQKKGK